MGFEKKPKVIKKDKKTPKKAEKKTSGVPAKLRSKRYYRDENGNEPAKDFLDGLDKENRARIWVQIDRLKAGSGDVEPVGEGVSELRIHHGPGFRVYFVVIDNDVVIVLLTAGDKSSQKKDIKAAKKYNADLKKRLKDNI